MPENYQEAHYGVSGGAQPKIAYEATQKIADDLLPFKRDPFTLFVDNNGQSPLPSDYAHVIIVWKLVRVSNKYSGAQSFLNFKPSNIDILTGDQSPIRRASQVLPPSLNNPICEFYPTYIQFYPMNILTAQMTYLGMPKTAVWAYTSPDGRTPQFDPTNSIDTDWPPSCHFDLEVRILQFFGINLGMQDIYAYSEQFKENGN